MFTFSIFPPLLHHPLLPLPICLMPLTPPTTPPSSKKIRIHSPFLHARLPQMLPLVQYARRSPPLLHSMVSGTKTSHTRMSPLPASSTTQTKKTCRRLPYPQQDELTPPSELSRLAGRELPFPSPTTMPSTEHSSLPSREYETTSTVAIRTSSKLKRSSELAELFNTEEPPATMKKPRYSLPSWTTSEGWNQERRLIPLHHHHPLTSPFRHQPYHATHKSRPVLWPPMPESAQWPTDQLRPSRCVPADHGVQGLKLVTWQLEYRLFQKVFESELSCCLLTRQEELRHRLP